MTPTRIVVLGGGAGGLELVCRLGERDDCTATLVDRVSTHLWKPRLHEFAAGTVHSSLSEMSFYMLAQMRGFHFEQGAVEAIDRAGKSVLLERPGRTDGGSNPPDGGGRRIGYDVLIVALGGVTPDFGTDGVAENAIRLDERRDADAFRERFIDAMITARETSRPTDVVIIGSGATGTELAAHLRQAEQAFFEKSHAEGQKRLLNLTILEAAPVLMPGADEELRRNVASRLEALDIAVVTGAKIAEVNAAEVRSAEGDRWPADIAVWAAGLVGNPVLKDLADFEMDKKARIVVDDHLRTTVDAEIFAMGDAASFTPADADQPLPPTAQCASQQADYLADALPQAIAGKDFDPFVYDDRGRLLSLANAGSVGLVGLFRKGDILVDGRFATAAYNGLQRRHQWAVLGPLRGSVAIAADMISPTRGPALKLHG
ncbi:NAD(P)/FAD-dependent oxidoreductase [Aurantimonas sp. VKM B-3413]|uniref:NAD(P)/FAD-dependent oxidoreductase n=1 Tax=Aurantimonas sp. VKM B-3413 TaxID=2779401 RepID=UPI001E4A9372|nr:FAD-dependent oxidoreductase [Aurantimonas sp. VKM B-3413]MCB8838666.1 FAD-dependent oxidoreductase [Aurantimonas sp. VKM B-3413]